jgi:tRNA(fMet)-specific endonuclease VapC
VTLRYLLDTNIVSVPVSSKPDPVILARLEANGPECAIAAPVWHELTYGCHCLPRGKRRRALEAYLREVVRASFPTLPYDEAAATWHGKERARLDLLGRPAPFVDGQIAAIAHVHGLVLVTTNDTDFRGFEGLSIENWSRPSASRRASRRRHQVPKT